MLIPVLVAASLLVLAAVTYAGMHIFRSTRTRRRTVHRLEQLRRLRP
jgi:hypothetical protein